MYTSVPATERDAGANTVCARKRGLEYAWGRGTNTDSVLADG